MPFDFSSFVNPNQFSDAATLSGFDKPMRSVTEAVEQAALASATGGASGGPSGVAPPNQSFMDVVGNTMSQAVAPYQQKFDQFTGVAGQAAQGNFGNAANMMLGKKIEQEAAPTINYDHQWH